MSSAWLCEGDIVSVYDVSDDCCYCLYDSEFTLVWRILPGHAAAVMLLLSIRWDLGTVCVLIPTMGTGWILMKYVRRST